MKEYEIITNNSTIDFGDLSKDLNELVGIGNGTNDKYIFHGGRYLGKNKNTDVTIE